MLDLVQGIWCQPSLDVGYGGVHILWLVVEVQVGLCTLKEYVESPILHIFRGGSEEDQSWLKEIFPSICEALDMTPSTT